MTSISISASKALALSIDELHQPVVTSYELALLLFKLYLAKNFAGQKLRVTKPFPTYREFSAAVNPLLDSSLLKPSKDFPRENVFEIYGRTNIVAEEIVCVVDPFSYISHLSAMAHHGLTDRLPRTLFTTSPSPSAWRGYAVERMKRDYNDHFNEFSDTTLPRLTRIPAKRIHRTSVHCKYGSHLGAYRTTKNSSTRVSTIGRTFLDMLRDPELCGGLNHVLDVFEEHAKAYLQLIVDEIDRHGSPIDKVRAGYVLEERCDLKSPVIEGWTKFVQRGGSRKLDSSNEYSPTYSKRWSISINIPDAKKRH